LCKSLWGAPYLHATQVIRLLHLLPDDDATVHGLDACASQQMLHSLHVLKGVVFIQNRSEIARPEHT